MTPLEAMRMAREALHRSVERMVFAEPWSVAEKDIEIAKEAITALTEAIKQMEEAEPVAWMIHTDNTNLHELDPNREANWLAFDAAEFKHNAARCLNVVEERPLFTHPAPTIPAGWQPIETAPKDGREQILLKVPYNQNGVLAWSDTWWISGFSAENKPTHWKPAPPSNAELRGRPLADGPTGATG